MIAAVFAFSCLALLAAYIWYGRFLARQFDVDDANVTPACSMTDGVDFVPARRAVLFGHHFSSIAGAGPIVGPIIAATWFGWGPALVWIVLGAIFIGGLHDFGSLVMSIRHRARSVAEICKLYLSPVTYRFFLVFIWLALVYVLIVFLDLTAAGFVDAPPEDPNRGGTVASASIFYIFLAVVFGLLLRRTNIGLRRGSLIFVPLIFLGLIGATFVPLHAERIPALIQDDSKFTWSLVLLIYCFIASITPVWVMLQPRDYLSSFLLFACLAFGGLGMLIGSFSGQLPAAYPAFRGFHIENVGYIFPVLFITVACGACSGFHSIVASGTTAKQLPEERAARPIAYGGMLTEAALAVVALATVMWLGAKPDSAPTVTFAAGIGQFLSNLGLSAGFGATFGLLAVSTFLLTTLDTCTRLSRYIVEEFLNVKGTQWRYLTTFITLIPLFYFAFKVYPAPGDANKLIPAWQLIWPAFGTTNQLLAALALLVVVVWRRSQGRAIWFIAPPMLFMLVTTCTSMVQLIVMHLERDSPTPLIGWINVVMLMMTALLVADTVKNWGRLGRRELAAASAPVAG